ncbi:hypothetical protein HKX48_008492, partial [Thoreauomyces humboldtii]
MSTNVNSEQSVAEKGRLVPNEDGTRKPKPASGITVPLALLLLVGSIVIAAAICVPVAVLAFRGADDTVTTIVAVVRENYSQIVRNAILDLGEKVELIASIGASGPGLLKVLAALVPGVHHDFSQDPDVVFELYSLYSSQSTSVSQVGFQRTIEQDALYLGISGASCSNLSTSNSLCDSISVVSVDYRTATVALDVTVGASPLGYDDPGTYFPVGAQFEGPTWYFDVSDPNSPVLKGLLSFYFNQWLGYPLGQNDTGVPIGNFEVVLEARQLSEFLATIQLTMDSLIAIWANNDEIVAISQLDMLADPSTFNASNIYPGTSISPGSAYSASMHPLPEISIPAKEVLAKYGTYENVPDNYVQTTKTSNGNYFTNLVRLQEYGMDWIIMVSIAEKDLDGPIVESRKRVLITSIVVAFGMLLIASAFSFAITLPLKNLTHIMKQATQMDFSALEGGFLERKIPIAELAVMQAVFAEMLHKFAAAIAANKRLYTRQATGGAGIQSSSVQGSTTGAGDRFLASQGFKDYKQHRRDLQFPQHGPFRQEVEKLKARLAVKEKRLGRSGISDAEGTWTVRLQLATELPVLVAKMASLTHDAKQLGAMEAQLRGYIPRLKWRAEELEGTPDVLACDVQTMTNKVGNLMNAVDFARKELDKVIGVLRRNKATPTQRSAAKKQKRGKPSIAERRDRKQARKKNIVVSLRPPATPEGLRCDRRREDRSESRNKYDDIQVDPSPSSVERDSERGDDKTGQDKQQKSPNRLPAGTPESIPVRSPERTSQPMP